MEGHVEIGCFGNEANLFASLFLGGDTWYFELFFELFCLLFFSGGTFDGHLVANIAGIS